MSNVDIIKQGLAQQNNYNGAKIVVHNPTVNVPLTSGYAKPDVQLYQYPEGKVPAEYYQGQLVNQPKVVTKPVIQLPDAKPVAEPPASVLEPVKTIPVPQPVYVEQAAPVIQPEAVEVKQEILQDAQIVEAPVAEIKAPVEAPLPAVEKVETAPAAPVAAEVVATEEPTEQAPVKKTIEIVPPVSPKPEVDYIQVCANLESQDYDVQAMQLKDIIDAAAMSEKTKDVNHIKPYHVEQIFIDIMDIVNKDTSSLQGPTDAQLQIRDKLVENYFSSVEQAKQGVPKEQIVVPHQISQQDINYANVLSPKELAERNKDYAIATLAVISKTFVDRVENETGTKVPITDVPGLAAIVNSLKSQNTAIRLTALDALSFIQKPEYARELTPIYDAIIRTDADENVRTAAQFVLDSLNYQVAQEQAPQQAA